MKERLKRLRNELGLNQQEFAERIGINRGTLANYEVGRNIPIDAVIKLICQTFNVNEDWLRSGEGKMFIESEPGEEIQKMIDSMSANDNLKRRLVAAILKLDEIRLRQYLDWIKLTFDLVDASDINVGRAAVSEPASPVDWTREELHARLDAELDLVEEGKGEDIDGTA